MSVRVVPESKLGVSQPNPSWFGNPSNPSDRKSKGWTNDNWLISRFHFSFAEYSNPKNVGFGVLRVLNDDLVQPQRGFGPHPHRDVEICTYIVEGSLTHKDSTGTEETLQRGAIQFMTAGTGVTHSEHNLDPSNPLRFIQIWINTRTRGLKPNYGSARGSIESRTDQWSHLVSDVRDAAQTPVKINQDANVLVTEGSNAVSLHIQQGRQAYLLCMEGSVALSSSAVLRRHEAAELLGPCSLVATPQGTMHLLMVEMAYTGPGRSDL